MFINNKLSRHLQQRINNRTKNTDSNKFFNLLTSPELLSTVEDLLPEHRERLYPPTETLSMFLAQKIAPAKRLLVMRRYSALLEVCPLLVPQQELIVEQDRNYHYPCYLD